MRAGWIIMLLCVLLGGCATSEADKKALQQGYSLYSARRLDEAEAIADKFVAANQASPNLDEGLYLRGVTRLAKGGGENRKMAAADLKQAAEKTQRPDLKSKAMRALGDIDFESNRWDQARGEYQQAMTGATPQAMAYLNYRIGACLQAVGKWDDAQPFLQMATGSAADSDIRERAVVRLNAKNFALQFGAFQDRTGAQTLVRQLGAAGITAAPTTEMREGKLLYIVRSGAYRTWQEASAARDRYLPRFPLVAIVP